MTKVTDDRLIEEVAYTPNATAKQLASAFDMTRQGIDKRLRKLERSGVLASEQVGSSVVWKRASDDHGDSHAETDALAAEVRHGSDFAVDIRADVDGDPSVLVQAGPDGYQMDVWWDDHSQASNWVNFEQADSDYPYDNRHPRRPSLDADEETVVIHDPEPRVPGMGFDGADIAITYGEKDGVPGFHATLTWTDERARDHERTSFLPMLDPRDDPERFTHLAYE